MTRDERRRANKKTLHYLANYTHGLFFGTLHGT
jgi:hypothetical protein